MIRKSIRRRYLLNRGIVAGAVLLLGTASHALENQVAGDELYDLKNDPHELENLAEYPAYVAVKLDLCKKLNQRVEDHIDRFYSLSVTSRKGKELDCPDPENDGKEQNK